MMYEAKRAFKIFSQSAEAAIKGLCASYGNEICSVPGIMQREETKSAIISHYIYEMIELFKIHENVLQAIKPAIA